jgi:hypothetical protein
MKFNKEILEKVVSLATFSGALYKAKVWASGDKLRIYADGGNNYHYDGSWFLDFSENGFEAKSFLKEGFRNKNSKEYVAKYCSEMEELFKNFITNKEEDSLSLFELDIELYNEINEIKTVDLSQVTGGKEQTLHYMFDMEKGFFGTVMA